jgi:hypothetical protein
MISPKKAVVPKKAPPKMKQGAFTGEITPIVQVTPIDHIYTPNENVFIPTWDNSPEERLPIVTLGGVGILTYQNTTAIISSPGSGKSSIVEAIGASFLNPNVDSLDFKIERSCKTIIIIDNERTDDDVWKSFEKMCSRARIRKGVTVEKVKIAGLRLVPSLKERLYEIERLLQCFPCSLLLIDGAGDLVTDINDAMQSSNCRTWLREMTAKYHLSIIVTLHPNPGTDRPRGHLGSEICREAECVLLVKPYDNDTRTITSDFIHGKNRNNPHITTAFKWSESDKMFMSVDYEKITAAKKTIKQNAVRQKMKKLAKALFIKSTSKKHSELVRNIMDMDSVSQITAKRNIKFMLDVRILKKTDTGFYILNSGEDEQ